MTTDFINSTDQCLNPNSGPPRIKRPYVQYGKEGQAVRVECMVESVPTPQRIVWSKNTRVVDVDNDDGYEIIEEPSTEESTLRSMILIRNSKLVSLACSFFNAEVINMIILFFQSDFGSYNCSVWNQFGFDSKMITLVQESKNQHANYQMCQSNSYLSR